MKTSLLLGFLNFRSEPMQQNGYSVALALIAGSLVL